ncbi:MAG: Allergen V5/Tpx-1 family protein [Actinobacteria bacterium]|nr:Allergen V5/Tpx-1 family protein [Actinomycetota bacterium]
MENSKGNSNGFGSPPAKRLLGQVLVDGGFITQVDLELALAEQIRTKERLGEVLIRMGKLGPEEIDVVVSVQGDLASLSGAVKAAAGGRHNLGDLLLKAKRVTPEQLGNALIEQQRTRAATDRGKARQGTCSPGLADGWRT